MKTLCIFLLGTFLLAGTLQAQRKGLEEAKEDLSNLLRSTSPDIREAMKKYLETSQINGDYGLYKQSAFAPKEWDLVAVFTNSANRQNCVDAQPVITQSSHAGAAYQCIPLPKDWHQHTIEHVRRSVTPKRLSSA